jgi:AraC-like DNA-binding protein
VTIGSIRSLTRDQSDCLVGAYYQGMRQTTAFRRRALFDEALEVIDRDFSDETLSLSTVARTIATSRRQLQRVFAERGTSFRSELQHVRMARAAELLLGGELSVSTVARSVGYRHPAQFSKAFRRHHGRPPSELRMEGVSLAA